MGAPRKHPPKNAGAEIKKLAAEGYAMVGIAARLGVSRDVFKRWLDEDGLLREAFDLGRENERIALHASLYNAAMAGKPANVNAIFLLKARHGYREGDQQQVSVAVAMQPVMVVKDHGNDAEWAAKAAEQQRRLASHSSNAAESNTLMQST